MENHRNHESDDTTPSLGDRLSSIEDNRLLNSHYEQQKSALFDSWKSGEITFEQFDREVDIIAQRQDGINRNDRELYDSFDREMLSTRVRIAQKLSRFLTGSRL